MFRTTRRAILWIIIPMISCMVAGFFFTLNGVTNMLLTLWILLYGGCVIEATVEVDLAMGISIFLWGLNLATGHVYAKVLEGFFSKEFSFAYAFYCLAMVGLVMLNVAYTREFKSELRRAVRRDESRESEEEQERRN